MGKKRRGQPIDLKSLSSGAFAVLEGDDGNDERGLGDAESVKSLRNGASVDVLDMGAVAAMLSAEFDSLDATLVLALLSDYHPETISAHLEAIRDQLGILQACAVPDDTADVISEAVDPSDSAAQSELAEQFDEAIYNAWDDETPMPGHVHAEKDGWLGASALGETSSASQSTASRPSSSARTRSSRSEATRASQASKSTSTTSIEEEEGGWPDVEWEDEGDVLQSLFPNQPIDDLRAVLLEATSLQAAIDQLLSIELIKEAEHTGVWADEADAQAGYPSEPEDDWEQASKGIRAPTAVRVEVPVELLESSPMSRSLSTTSGLSSRSSASAASSSSWQSARSKKSPVEKTRTSVKGKKKTITVPLVDTLQRRATPVNKPTSSALNAWGSISSLAAHLSELFPEHNSVFFQSYLHSPDYRSAHAAVRAALLTLPIKTIPAGGPTEQILQDLFGLALLPGELGKRKQADLKLVMKVGGDDIGVVMDLVDILEEVSHWPADTDDAILSEYDSYTDDEHAWEQPDSAKVVRNAVSPVLPTTSVVDLPARMATLRAGKKVKGKGKPAERIIPGASAPPSAANTNFVRDDFGTPPSSPRIKTPSLMPVRDLGGKKQVHPQNWRKVQSQYSHRDRHSHPYARSIPAYAQGSTNGTSFSSAPGGLTVSQCLSRAAAERARRAEAIRRVSSHFEHHLPGGKAINASVAGHYASQAREAQDNARKWELQAARMVVGAQMDRTGNTVDLHHLTVDEARTVAVESADRWWAAEQAKRGQAKSIGLQPIQALTIITGVGRHSVGNKGVLGPAVAKELQTRGWRVEGGQDRSGYLSVKGKR